MKAGLPYLREQGSGHIIQVSSIGGVNAEYLHERLPNSKLDLLDAAHYPWEDLADQYAAIIMAWVKGSYQNTGA